MRPQAIQTLKPLPRDVKLLIFSFFDMATALNAQAVCLEWYQLFKTDQLRSIVFQTMPDFLADRFASIVGRANAVIASSDLDGLIRNQDIPMLSKIIYLLAFSAMSGSWREKEHNYYNLLIPHFSATLNPSQGFFNGRVSMPVETREKLILSMSEILLCSFKWLLPEDLRQDHNHLSQLMEAQASAFHARLPFEESGIEDPARVYDKRFVSLLERFQKESLMVQMDSSVSRKKVARAARLICCNAGCERGFEGAKFIGTLMFIAALSLLVPFTGVSCTVFLVQALVEHKSMDALGWIILATFALFGDAATILGTVQGIQFLRENWPQISDFFARNRARNDIEQGDVDEHRPLLQDGGYQVRFLGNGLVDESSEQSSEESSDEDFYQQYGNGGR